MCNECNALGSSRTHCPPRSMEKLFSRKLVPASRTLGDHCPTAHSPGPYPANLQARPALVCPTISGLGPHSRPRVPIEELLRGVKLSLCSLRVTDSQLIGGWKCSCPTWATQRTRPSCSLSLSSVINRVVTRCSLLCWQVIYMQMCLSVVVEAHKQDNRSLCGGCDVMEGGERPSSFCRES